jgi:hypothetical protein
MYVSGASNVHKRRLLALSSQMRLMSFSSASAGHCVDPAGIADSQGQLLLLSSPSVLAERRGEVGFVLAGIWTWSFILGCVRSKQLFASIIICYNWLQIRRVQFLASCTRLVHFLEWQKKCHMALLACYAVTHSHAQDIMARDVEGSLLRRAICCPY